MNTAKTGVESRESRSISVDRKQQFAVSLKGSSLCVRNDRRDEKVSRNSGSRSGVPEAGTAQAATQIQVFDKKVERASREMKRGFKSE